MRDLIFPPWRWGIFHPKRCGNELIVMGASPTSPMLEIYNALVGKGFRETIWQYVYPRQIGGLIRGYGKGAIEVHIRFFEGDRIYSEVEMGRIGLIHFSGRRMYGNNFIKNLTRSSISLGARNYLASAIENHKNENVLFEREWRPNSGLIDKRLFRIQRFFGSWIFISILMLFSVTVISSQFTSLFVIVIPALILLYTITRNNKY